VDLGSESVHGTKKGSSYRGCCPFHSEKTPSFHVVPDRQIYKCLGCGKGDGAINYVMELENQPLRDAVTVLAKRAGRTMHGGKRPLYGGTGAPGEATGDQQTGSPNLPSLALCSRGGGGTGLFTAARFDVRNADPIRIGLCPQSLGRVNSGTGRAGLR
jgi:DNA primase (bacterial type)